MPVEMVLNELSYRQPAENVYIARNWFSNLRQTIQAATDLGVARILRTDRIFYEIPIAPNYLISNWLHDREVDEVERSFIRSITAKSPYLEDIDPAQSLDAELYEFIYDGESANGLRYAHWLDALAVSMLSHDRWDRNHIENISMECLDPDADQITVTQGISVRHASRPAHLSAHSTWIALRRADSLRDGNDIWFRQSELFPSLLFCEPLRRQLRAIHASHQVFKQLKKHLVDLEAYCSNWENGPFNAQQLPGKPRTESEATLHQYGQERTFLCPDGARRLFSWHMNLNPGTWRLHFFPLENEKKIIIGYVGPHLRIVSTH